MAAEEDERAVAEFRGRLADAVAALMRAGAADEALARFEPARRRMLVTRRSAMVPLGRVWRLGAVLLDADTRLYATGLITRAVDPKWRQHQAVSAEVRREYRAAAFRGPFAGGETVDFDAPPIELSVPSLRAASGPVMLRDARVLVRWAADPAVAPMLFERYLAERVELLAHPPEGA